MPSNTSRSGDELGSFTRTLVLASYTLGIRKLAMKAAATDTTIINTIMPLRRYKARANSRKSSVSSKAPNLLINKQLFVRLHHSYLIRTIRQLELQLFVFKQAS